MSTNGNRGVTLPSALMRPTPPTPTRPDPDPSDDEGDPVEGQGSGREPRPKARRTRKPPADGPGSPRKLTIPDDVYERLQLQALQKKTTASAVAADLLNRNLPRFRVEREG